jgi:hypothetical protein
MSKYDRGDLTGARLELARNGQQQIDAGKALGDKLWRFLMAHESALRALVAEAEKTPLYTADELACNDATLWTLSQNQDALFGAMQDWLDKNPRPEDDEVQADETA